MRKLYPLNVVIQGEEIIMCVRNMFILFMDVFWGVIHLFFLTSSLVSIISRGIL